MHSLGYPQCTAHPHPLPPSQGWECPLLEGPMAVGLHLLRLRVDDDKVGAVLSTEHLGLRPRLHSRGEVVAGSLEPGPAPRALLAHRVCNGDSDIWGGLRAPRLEQRTQASWDS